MVERGDRPRAELDKLLQFFDALGVSMSLAQGNTEKSNPAYPFPQAVFSLQSSEQLMQAYRRGLQSTTQNYQKPLFVGALKDNEGHE